MKQKKTRISITLAGIGILALATLLVVALVNNKTDDGYVYITGTVTKYDSSPAAYDGSIIFTIDNVLVDIGGGLAPRPYGDVDPSYSVGDKVKAKVKRASDGSFTLYGCPECYVMKK